MTDQELVHETLKSPNAFAELVERYEKKITRYVKGFLYVSPEDAEDIVQEIFINVYKYLLSYNQALSFSSWIYRIAHNQCVSYLRKNAKRKQKEQVSLDVDEDLAENLTSDIDTELEVIKSLSYEEVMKAIEKLDNQSRAILILRYLEEKDYAEIADILKTSEGNVASLLHRAKNKLKEKISHE